MKIEKPQPQETIGKYPVMREIGSGATSHVYLARDTFAERDVAIKVLDFAQRRRIRETERMQHKAFVAEASLAGKLNHPHIVDIYDAVVEPDRSYLVMEYVPGTYAGDALGARPAAADRQGGRDHLQVHPRARVRAPARHHPPRHQARATSCCRPTARPRSRDFGASFQQRLEDKTTQIKGIGSPAYMSPEQLPLEPLNQQTDIYSLGVTMFRLLTGRLPFEAGSHVALTYAILNTPPPKPSSLRPDLPPLLDEIVHEGDRQGSGQALPLVARLRQGHHARLHEPAPGAGSLGCPTRRSSANCATCRSSSTSARSSCGRWYASAAGRPSSPARC